MLVRLKKVACMASRGCLSKEVKKRRRWNIACVLAWMLALGDANNCKHLPTVLVPETRIAWSGGLLELLCGHGACLT